MVIHIRKTAAQACGKRCFHTVMCRGVSTCSTVAPAGSMGSTKTSAGTPLDAVAGDVSGRYCWCKMTHPMSSLWAFYSDRRDASTCTSDCTNYCGHAARDYSDVRGGLFGSVAAANAAF